MEKQQDLNQTPPKLSYKGTVTGLCIGVLLCLVHWLFMLICPALGFFAYDRPVYKKRALAYQKEQELKLEAERLAALEEQRIAEDKKLGRQLKARQKKNRADKASLYRNIYTVAGHVLATQSDLHEYIKNAEDLIAHFNVSDEERFIAVEAFNSALDVNFDIENFIYSYNANIGKNRDYIEYVLTNAFLIASIDGVMHFEAQDRFIELALALGSTKIGLKRLFASKGAEAKFAREFDEKQAKGGKTAAKKSKKTEEKSSNNSSVSVAQAAKSSEKNQENSKGSDSGSGSSESDSSSHSDDYNRIAQALEILGLTSKSTFDDVKKAHKKLMLKYHPDRLASQGLPEDMIVVYTEKAKAVQVAFDYLRDLYNQFA